MSDLAITLKADSNQQLIRFLITDETTNAGKTGLVSDFEGLAVFYMRPGDTAPVNIGLSAGTLGTWTSGGWSEIGDGFYELGLPNAVIASGVLFADVWVRGISGISAPSKLNITLVRYDPDNATNLGLSALPPFSVNGTGGLVTNGTGTGQINLSSGAVRVQSGTATGQILQSSGQVSVYANSDKNNYNLTQAFPSNFSSLSITAGTGRVTVGTNADKTGYSLAQTFPANFANLAISVGGNVTAGTVTDKSGYSISGTLTTLDALNTSLSTAHGAGSWATPTNFSTLDQAGVRAAIGMATANMDSQLGTILNSVSTTTVTVSSPVVNAGSIVIERGDDYYQADGRGFIFTFSGFPSFVGGTAFLEITGMATQEGDILSATSVGFDLPSSETSKPVDSPARFSAYIILSNGHRVTLTEGNVTLE